MNGLPAQANRIAVFLLAMQVTCCSPSASAEEKPGWQNGISTWNGQGYSLPVISDAGVELNLPMESLDRRSYTIPTQPEASHAERSLSGQGSHSDFNGDPKSDPVSMWDAGFSDRPTLRELPTDSVEIESATRVAAATSDSDKPAEPLPPVEQPLTAPPDTQNKPETAPLQTDVTQWYQYPRRWMKGWDSHAEFGLDGSDGNANTLAMQVGMELKRKTDHYTLGMDVNYRQASSRNKTTEENGRFNVNYDRLLGDTPWSAFIKQGMEWDRFKPFDLRLNLNAGAGYYWVRNDDTTLATRFGGGASREIGAPMDAWIPEAVFGFEAEHQMTDRQKLKGKFDYFPAWENFGDYRLVSDVSWELLLDGSENLSLKLAATDRYDSSPQGARPNDVYYSLLLLYKF